MKKDLAELDISRDSGDVVFDKENQTFTITVQGNEHDYIECLQALALTIPQVENKEHVHCIATLLTGFLSGMDRNFKLVE